MPRYTSSKTVHLSVPYGTACGLGTKNRFGSHYHRRSRILAEVTCGQCQRSRRFKRLHAAELAERASTVEYTDPTFSFVQEVPLDLGSFNTCAPAPQFMSRTLEGVHAFVRELRELGVDVSVTIAVSQ